MWTKFCLATITILFTIGTLSGQNIYFRLNKENTEFNNNVQPMVSKTIGSRTSCLLTCLNHEQCCFVQIKKHFSKLICSLFPLLTDLADSNEVADSNIYTIADNQKCVKKECFDWFQLGFKTDGIYNIVINQKVTKVFCDMTHEEGGWTVFQSRIDGSVDFQRTWDEYKNGFGDVAGEYWLGNDFIHQMKKPNKKALIRIKATDFSGATEYVIYEGFWIDNEANKYNLKSGSFVRGNENLKSDWLDTNGLSFSTKDQDNDNLSGSCANMFSGGWWFGTCFFLNPNGIIPATENIAFGQGMTWNSWTTQLKSLNRMSMSLKAID